MLKLHLLVLPRIFLILFGLIDIAQLQEGLVEPYAAAFQASMLTSAAPCIFITRINQVDVLLRNFDLSDTGIVVFLLLGLVEGVSHNRDEHIEEDNEDESGRAKEEKVDEDLLLF